MTKVNLSALILEAPGSIVGAAIGVCEPTGEISLGYRGVRQVGAVEEIDGSTLFPTGSFAKVLTAFMLCQHVDAMRLDLDAPVAQWVPEIEAMSPSAALITTRHLLSHHSGLPDLFKRLDSDSDVFSCLTHADCIGDPGWVFSYSNAAYVVLGVLLRRLSGRIWSENIDAIFVRPMGLGHTIARENSAQSPLVATDHVFRPDDGTPVVAEMWPRVGDCFAAAGSTLCCSIGDMARLGSVALLGRDVLSSSGPWLSEQMLTQMQTVQARLPGLSLLAGGWGLGWSIDSDGAVSHGGGSSVHVLGDPKAGRVSAFATNTPNGTHLGRILNRQALGLPEAPKAAGSEDAPEDFALLLGSYASPLIRIEIEREGERLCASVSPFGYRVLLSAAGGRVFSGKMGDLESEFHFLGAPGTRASHLHAGLRALKRV
jgi:CubicO group peptidase (beta-lactamase class C family)